MWCNRQQANRAILVGFISAPVASENKNYSCVRSSFTTVDYSHTIILTGTIRVFAVVSQQWTIHIQLFPQTIRVFTVVSQQWTIHIQLFSQELFM